MDDEGYGDFHAWIAPTSGAAPFELLEITQKLRNNGERKRMSEVQVQAVDMLCDMTGLPVPEDFKVAVQKLRGNK